ncbi:hypothetical protein DV515_00011913 [Chloebia gouldiae]|uniref:Uncharacterized protein n=1 Tax=Chloebia gouldiae TaxID=44316 RepID=A0A3L8S527_CHLGU|nr:hypothetical protein DV515_00011913 [Chloebia gouldiae]
MGRQAETAADKRKRSNKKMQKAPGRLLAALKVSREPAMPVAQIRCRLLVLYHVQVGHCQCNRCPKTTAPTP